MNYICLNGEILPAKHAKLSLDNRAFRYGEGIVEEMRSSGVRIPFFADHFKRLTKGLEKLGISYYAAFTEDSLKRNIELLLHRHKAYNINKVTITLWREDDKDILATKTEVEYLIEVETLEEKQFVLNEKGLIADIFRGSYKANSFLSPYNTSSALLRMMAMHYAKEMNINAPLILNEEGKILEEANSNIFFANGKSIYTPDLDSGCTNGIMRQKILDIADKAGFIIIETAPLAVSFFLEVEEVFLTNDVYGIRWVGGYKHKRYRKKRTVDFVKHLNRLFDEV